MICVISCTLFGGIGWVLVSRWLGKRHIYFIGGPLLGLAMMNMFFMFTFGLPTRVAALITSSVIGGCTPVLYLTPLSLLPDVIDVDEYITGKRREGIFSSFCTLMLKLSVSIALTITNLVFEAAGYVSPQSTCSSEVGPENQDSDPDVQASVMIGALKCITGLVPAALVVVAMGSVYVCPITKKSVEVIALQLQTRRLDKLAGQNKGGTLSKHNGNELRYGITSGA